MLGDAEELKAEYMLVEDYHITEMQDLLQCKDLSVRTPLSQQAYSVSSARIR